jgi:hypothetical protein
MKPWWKLSDSEKSKRSFWLAPFCLLILFLPETASFEGHWNYTITFVCLFGFLIQGYVYKRKSRHSNEKESGGQHNSIK